MTTKTAAKKPEPEVTSLNEDTIQSARFTIKGSVPLLMHNGQLADPLNRYAREMKRLGAKSPKTDEIHEAMARLEWAGGLYQNGETTIDNEASTVSWTPEARVILPTHVIKACIIAGAKHAKLGEKSKAAVFVLNAVELDYEGPKDINDLSQDARFIDRRGCSVGMATIMRTRPIFKAWSATIAVEFDSTLLNFDQVRESFKMAGRARGIGDYIPEYGRFSVTEAEHIKAPKRTAVAAELRPWCG